MRSVIWMGEKQMDDKICCKDVMDFYKGKRVLITGNTGFKGSWLTYMLLKAGAIVTGFSLAAPTKPNLFAIADLASDASLNQYFSDVRDLDQMKKIFIKERPKIVFHLAAQPIVRTSYRNPVDTYSINVMGTVNVCECVRLSLLSAGDGGIGDSQWGGVKSFLNVTTDKVYRNNEWDWGYRETDFLDGQDPYSNSKSCSELITHSYKESYFTGETVRASTVRAGNVIGGGDFSSDRIIPDCVRALQKEGIVEIRNPNSIRPYQHVLEPLFVYLLIAKSQYIDPKFQGYFNVGPDDIDCVSTGDLADLFCDVWNKTGAGVKAVRSDKKDRDAPHEAKFLKLDSSKLKATFGWRPRWDIYEAVKNTILWTKVWMENSGDSEKIKMEMDRELEEFGWNGGIRDDFII